MVGLALNVNIIHHISRIKKKNPRTISINAENLEEIQHSFLIFKKYYYKLKIDVNVLIQIKGIRKACS
jgi:SHS2 domain-containing protein